MGKLCMIMQHIPLFTPFIAFMLVSHACIFAIDYAKQGREEPQSQHQSRPITTSKIKSSPSVSNHHP
jgi:hypothetical protein